MEYVLVLVLISIIAFLLLREFFCWYFKINKRISLIEELINEVKKIKNDEFAENNEQNKKRSRFGGINDEM